MSKTKIWTAALIAMLMLAALAGTAYASASAPSDVNAPSLDQGGPGQGGPDQGRQHGRVMGEVTAVADDEFTLLIRDDVEISVQVDENTRYFGDLESFEDVEVGLTVAVAGVRQGDETALAHAVGTGDDRPLGQGAHGEVTDLDTDSITIEGRDGESVTFQVDDETNFHSREGDVESLNDIEVGDFVAIRFEEAADGSLIAKSIAVGAPDNQGRPDDQGAAPNGGPTGPGQGNSSNNTQGVPQGNQNG